MKIISNFIFLLVFLYSDILFSQTPHYYHYTSSDGLSSSTIYDIIQDSQGFIWFGTANGISKFDGHKFKNFGIKEGLNSNLITSVVEGSDKNIYASNYEKGVNVYKGDSIENYKLDYAYPLKLNFIFRMNDKLMGYFAGVVYNFDNQKVSESATFIAKENNTAISPNTLTALTDGTLLASTSRGFYKVTGHDYTKINVEGISNDEIYFACEYQNNGLIACSDNKIFSIENYKVKHVYSTEEYSGKVNRVYKDRKGNLWFSIMNKGFYVIYTGENKIVNLGQKFGLEKSIVTRFMEDNEGNIWITTQGKGAYCITNLYIKSYGEENGLSNNSILRIDMEANGNLLLGTVNGLNIFDKTKFIQYGSNEDVSLTPYIHDLSIFNNKVYVGSSFRRDIVIKKLYNNIEYIFYFGTSLCLTKDSNIYIGSWGNQVYQSKTVEDVVRSRSQFFYAFDGGNIVNKINKIFEDSENNLWIGTSLGLCMKKNEALNYFKENGILNSSISAIKEDDKKNVWIAGEKGISSYSLKDKKISEIKHYGETDFSSSTSIAFDAKHRMWIGNMKGLFIVDSNECKLITTGQGLPSDEVLSLYYEESKNIIWVGTSNGLCSFDINEFENEKLPILTVDMDNIKAGELNYSKYENLKFESENNNILINFRVINYSSPFKLQYQYKINDNWINSQNSSLDFRSMQHGSYSVSFRAKLPNGEWSKPGVISFTIKPKFTETIWFLISIFGCFSIIVLFVARYRINQNKKQNFEKTEVSKRISELKLHALSATMNPHFIFNSLNSVQYLVNKGKKLEANEYISIMARLIRKNLDTANDSFILLSEEIEKLNLYLEVEQLRFQEKFKYEINVDENLNTGKVMIPNMIVQPFVENAVWHGIMNIDKKGLVKISFNFEEVTIEFKSFRCLVIKISDNGIGIKKSVQLKKDGHISHGIKIIQERLQLLSKELELPQPIVFEDLSLRNELSTGTEVIISLPDTLFKLLP